MKVHPTAAFYLILGTASLVLLQACSKVSSPTAPSAAVYGTDPTPTPVISSGVSEIHWYSAVLSHSNTLGSDDLFAQVDLSVNGVAESTAQVVLSGNGVGVTLPYTGTVNLGGNNYARYRSDGSPLQYQAGAAYTLSTQTSVGMAWASITAPGGIHCASDGSHVSWASEGTQDRVYVETTGYSGTYDSLNGHTDVDSVFTIPTSAYPAPGSYYVRTTCDTVVGAVNNAMAGSSLEASDVLWAMISR